MSTAYTANAKLGQPAIGDTGWASPINANAAALDAINAIGDLCVTTKEVPSSSLNVAVAAGLYVRQDGTVGTYAGTASQALTPSATSLLYLDLANSGILTVAGAYPATAHVRLASVVAGSLSISTIADNRVPFMACGSWADGVNIGLGTSAGTQVGTSASQKLGFLGAAPASQQAGGAAAAGATYTSAEQSMLNKCYAALRTFGLLS